MSERVGYDQYPLWVKLSLWGVPGRRGLWAFVFVSIACGIAMTTYGLWDRRYFAGAAFFLAAIPYWMSIRWIDAHGVWERKAPPKDP